MMEADPPLEKLDYEFWATMPGWTVSEAAALFCGLDPEKIVGTVSGAEYQRMLFRLTRSVEMDDIESPSRPPVFIQWAADNGIDIDQMILSSVIRGKIIKNWKKNYKRVRRKYQHEKAKLKEIEKQLDPVKPKQLRTLQVLIYSMAVDKFSYSKNPTKTTSAIDDAVTRAGLTLDKDTIRNTLRDAKDTLGDPAAENG